MTTVLQVEKLSHWARRGGSWGLSQAGVCPQDSQVTDLLLTFDLFTTLGSGSASVTLFCAGGEGGSERTPSCPGPQHLRALGSVSGLCALGPARRPPLPSKGGRANEHSRCNPGGAGSGVHRRGLPGQRVPV